MEENSKVGIVDLIDRTLNKGIILNADLVITVADVPLLAANLKLALASVETMLKYGIMQDLLNKNFVISEDLTLARKSKIEKYINCKEYGKIR